MSSNLDAKKATKIHLFNFSSAAMRAFHMSWLAFFVCFFAWFACAPLMPHSQVLYLYNIDMLWCFLIHLL